MQKIIPNLWYDKESFEAAKMYTELFENSAIDNVTTLYDTPSGDAELVSFHLSDLNFSAISGGPFFKINHSVSFMVACSTTEEVTRLHEGLSKGGTELMPLGEYPFSKWYAWIQDKYGLGWQILLVDNMDEHKRISPCLLFCDKVCGLAETAMNFYSSVFKDSEVGYVTKYNLGENTDIRAKIKYGELVINGIELIFMDHGLGGEFVFNEAVSFIVSCENQEEIDYYWEKLSFVPEAEQCGWCKDQFGVSWQIVPENLDEMLFGANVDEKKRLTENFLKMKKIEISELLGY